jgi:hypothetical protein
VRLSSGREDPSFPFHRLHTPVSHFLLNYLRGGWRLLSPSPSTLEDSFQSPRGLDRCVLCGMNPFWVYAAVISWGVVSGVRAVDVLSTTGFATCGNGTQDISVSEFDMSFDRTNNELNFAVAGNSLISQNVIGITPLPS